MTFWLAAVSRAAAFALTGVLSLAAVVTGFASALTFAGVFALAGMLVRGVLLAHL